MTEVKIEKTALLISSCFILLFVLGYLFPNLWWGTHFFSFLNGAQLIVLLLLIAVGFIFQFFKIDLKLPAQLNMSFWAVLLVSILYGIIVYASPVIADYYGDAYKYLDVTNKTIPIIPKGTHEAFFSIDISPDAGEQRILALVTYIGYFFKTTYKEAFQLLGVFFGSLFAFTWISFINKQVSLLLSKFLLMLAGLTAPFTLFFFGHLEIYAPIYFFNLLWLTQIVYFIQNPTKTKAVALFVLLIICIFSHGSALLYLPIFVFLVLNHLVFYQAIKVNWKQISNFLFIPVAIAGLILYFFVFEDHIDNRSFKEGTIRAWQHLFLPLFSPDPPLDNYNILSFNHLFDYFNQILCWSPVALFLVVLIILTKKKVINWSDHSITAIGSIFILYASLFFVINPLISMPRDWDLFSLPAIPLLVLTCMLLKQVEKELLTHKVLLNGFIIFVVSFSVFMNHYDRNRLADRLEALAFRINDSYYEWTSQTFRFSNHCRNKNPNYLERNQVIIEKLRPNAKKGIDYEFANLLYEQGKAHTRNNKFNFALEQYEEALIYYPNHYQTKMKMVEPYFFQKRYEEAYQVAKDLVIVGYPNPQKAHRIALHCAIEAKKYDEALKITAFYTANWADDFVEQVHYKLIKGDSLDTIKYLFKR
ncbi:MAG: tetratricopeptide repeat protein [Flavobacteriaceae bacterium]|nr:tetratricopeptide repeat protein [Flavobacteriaceae bacterium]